MTVWKREKKKKKKKHGQRAVGVVAIYRVRWMRSVSMPRR
jgi:hypothetical protein